MLKISAGDYGATFSLSRTFNNGWDLLFATLTDVRFYLWEGSFDKGITLKVHYPGLQVKIGKYRKLLLDQLLVTEERLILEDDNIYIMLSQNMMKKVSKIIGIEFLDDKIYFSVFSILFIMLFR